MNARTLALGSALLAGLAACEPAAPPAASTVAPLATWAFLPWDEAVGRIIGNESASEGPKSFALEPDGGMLVLDQVNRRILALDRNGRVARALPLPGSTFDDVEQLEGRAILVLDRLVGRRLLALDFQGAIVADVPLEGRGIERAGLVTAMLPRPDGVWLEVEHRHAVQVLDRDLRPCERRIVLGRPIANGRSLRGALDGRGGVDVSVAARTERSAELSVHLASAAPIERIVWLDADAAGRIHAVLHEVRRDPAPPYGATSERYVVVLLDERLRELGRGESPWVPGAYDQEVEFRVAADGRLWQMAFTPGGVLLLDGAGRQP
jgi:hypothetical protein